MIWMYLSDAELSPSVSHRRQLQPRSQMIDMVLCRVQTWTDTVSGFLAVRHLLRRNIILIVDRLRALEEKTKRWKKDFLKMWKMTDFPTTEEYMHYLIMTVPRGQVRRLYLFAQEPRYRRRPIELWRSSKQATKQNTRH